MLTERQIIQHAKENGWVLERNPQHNRYGAGGYWRRDGHGIPFGTFSGPRWQDINGKQVKVSEGPYRVSPAEAMRKSLDHNDRCQECNLWVEYGYHGLDRPASLCFRCRLWLKKISDYNSDSRYFVTYDNRYYAIGMRSTPSIYNGFSGMWFTIEFDDGKIVKTCDLWFGGKVPERFHDRLKPTAKFI